MGVKWAKVTNDGSVLLVWKTRLGGSDDIKMKKYLKLWHEVNNEAKAKHDKAKQVKQDKESLKLAGQAVRQIIDKLKKALKKWPDKKHPYYKDIQKIVKENNPTMRGPGGKTIHLPYSGGPSY
jgi:predicted  nucleic acid-binding Zn-ribbon protein